MRVISIILLFLTAFSVFGYAQKTVQKDYSLKIKKATPLPLPQKPVVKRLTSDAQDDRLKGKVKSVIEESESFSTVAEPFGKQISSITDYDKQGNYLRQVNYDYQGRPYGVTVFGYIDGARASLSNSILYGDEGYTTDLKEINKTRPKPDPRFTFKYEYKYEDGKMTEMQTILNTNEKGTRYVYKHYGNRIEYLVYLSDGELNQKYIYTYDGQGNEIEKLSFNVRKQVPFLANTYRSKYESFDKVGNWTKKIISEVITEKGKEIEKLRQIEYRKITYYP